MPEVTNRIRELRELAGLSSEELGRKVGLSGPRIRRLETDARPLTVYWMGKIAPHLGVEPADLLRGRTGAPPHGAKLLARGTRIARANWHEMGFTEYVREADEWIELLEIDAVILETIEALRARRGPRAKPNGSAN